MKQPKNYIVYAPNFDETSGGNIFLHLLVHSLNSLGETALLWPWNVPPNREYGKILLGFVRKPSNILNFDRTRRKLTTNPDFNTPQARYSDLHPDSIVVYPEVTLGNPLKAQNVVRWLLYTPGVKDPFEFTKGEMFFRAGEMSDIPGITGGATDLYLWYRNAAYRNENRPDRTGVCYTIRKGKGKPLIPETENAICIDGLSHQETADIFNKCAVFYSYDEATFYSQYAALCGCLSVIVPGQFHDRAEWVRAHPLGRYGVAYGREDAAHALATLHMVDAMLTEKVNDGLRTVEAFIKATQKMPTGSAQ